MSSPAALPADHDRTPESNSVEALKHTGSESYRYVGFQGVSKNIDARAERAATLKVDLLVIPLMGMFCTFTACKKPLGSSSFLCLDLLGFLVGSLKNRKPRPSPLTAMLSCHR